MHRNGLDSRNRKRPWLFVGTLVCYVSLSKIDGWRQGLDEVDRSLLFTWLKKKWKRVKSFDECVQLNENENTKRYICAAIASGDERRRHVRHLDISRKYIFIAALSIGMGKFVADLSSEMVILPKRFHFLGRRPIAFFRPFCRSNQSSAVIRTGRHRLRACTDPHQFIRIKKACTWLGTI